MSDKLAADTHAHATSDVSTQSSQQSTPQKDGAAPANLPASARIDPAAPASARARSEAITTAQSTIGTARLNRLINPRTETGTGAQPVENLPAAAVEAVRSPGTSGQPLDSAVRARVEHSVGADLGAVRVHQGDGAAAAVGSIGARAFANGQDIFLGAGESPTDTRLMAHELAHVVQQDGQRRAVQADNGNRTDPLEREADHVAQAVQNGSPADLRGKADTPRVQRQAGDQADPDTVSDPLHTRLEDAANEAWLNANTAEGWSEKAYWMRVGLIESLGRPLTIHDQAALEAYIAQAEFEALDEEVTANIVGDELFQGWTPAFPELWSARVYDALHLADVDLPQLADSKRERFDDLINVGAAVVPWVLAHGLPLTADEASSFTHFVLSGDPARLAKAPILKDYLNALYRYMGAGGMLYFYGTWEAIALNIKTAIADGTQFVTYADYSNYVQNEGRILAELPARLKTTGWNDPALAALNQDVLGLADVSFIRGFASSLVGLLGMVGLGHDGRDLFDARLAEVDDGIKALSGEERVIRAFTWAHEQGYFAAAGEQLWQAIREHGLAILGSVATFIALQFIPVVNIGVDVAVVVLGGVDLLAALGDLTDVIRLAWAADDLARLERVSPRIAAASIGDGFRIIVDLIGIASGIRGIKAHAAKLLEVNPGLTEEEALKKALREGAGKDTAISRLTAAEEWLERNGRSALARQAIGLARGNVDDAQVVLQFLRGGAMSAEDAATLRRIAPDLAEVADTMVSAARAQVSTGRLLEYLRDATIRAADRTSIAQALRRLIEMAGQTEAELNAILTHFARPGDLATVIRALEEMHLTPGTIRDVLRTAAAQGRTAPEVVAFARGAATVTAASTAERIAIFERAFQGRLGFRGGGDAQAIAEIIIETPAGPRAIRITEYDLTHYRTGHTFEDFSFAPANVNRAAASTFWPPGTTPETITMQARLAVNEAAPQIGRAFGRQPQFYRVPGNVTVGGYQYRVGIDLATGRLTQFFPEGGAAAIRVTRAELEAAADRLRAAGRLP